MSQLIKKYELVNPDAKPIDIVQITNAGTMPTLVKWFGHTAWFKKMWKGKLDRMVANLNTEGVEDTPYEDRNW